MSTAINIPATQAEDLKSLPENCALISINEEHEPKYPLGVDDQKSNVLRVVFSDVGSEAIEHKGKFYNSISVDSARQVVNFIKRNEGKSFIVHCAAGVSRSAAVCLFIHLIYGHELRQHFWHVSQPNPFVLGRLMVEYVLSKSEHSKPPHIQFK